MPPQRYETLPDRLIREDVEDWASRFRGLWAGDPRVRLAVLAGRSSYARGADVARACDAARRALRDGLF